MACRIRLISILAMAWALFCLKSVSRAQFGPHLQKALDSATTIVIGRLDQYIAEPESLDRFVNERMRSSEGGFMGNPEAVVFGTVQPRGTYVFTILNTLQGHPRQPLVVRLPRVSDFGSIFSGLFSDLKTHIPLKGRYLLLLSGDEKSGFAPTTVAPIPLSDMVQAPKNPLDNAKPDERLASVVRMFIVSLADPATRRVAAYMLSDAESDEALKALRPYAGDPDDDVRCRALECMATNQDVAAIPKIAAWRYSDPHISGNPVVTALTNYKTAAAIPFLNPLLLDSGSQYTRQNAADALRNLPPDKSSIPFLIKALRDPENQIVKSTAYYCLNRLIPELGMPERRSFFSELSEEQIKPFESWWADEQAGKHKQP